MAWGSPNDKLRVLLGEKIPEGGSDADTYFTDAEIVSILADNQGNTRRAAYEGWQMKAAYYAELITVSEGNALRQMSDLHKHALDMVKQFSGSGTSLTAGRTRIGRIRRIY